MRSQVFGSRSRVIVDIDDEKARRVFVQFADADAKKRASKVLDRAKAEAPVGKTGDLRAGLTMSQSRDVFGRWSVGYDVTSNAPYSLYVIKGTRPHLIKPKAKDGVLAFLAKGDLVFARYVNHPGTKPDNFMSRALRAAR